MTADIPNRCPHCGAQLLRATGIDTEGIPRPGDTSLCSDCGKASVFDEGLKLRLPDVDELDEINHSELVTTAQLWWANRS